MDEGIVRNVNVFFVTYIIICMVSMLLISLENFSFETTLSSVVACINNIGPGFDVVGPVGNYSQFSAFGKMVLSADMLLGRLEIFPLLLLFAPSMWKRGR